MFHTLLQILLHECKPILLTQGLIIYPLFTKSVTTISRMTKYFPSLEHSFLEQLSLITLANAVTVMQTCTSVSIYVSNGTKLPCISLLYPYRKDELHGHLCHVPARLNYAFINEITQLNRAVNICW
jgi:hypothetical protein